MCWVYGPIAPDLAEVKAGRRGQGGPQGARACRPGALSRLLNPRQFWGVFSGLKGVCCPAIVLYGWFSPRWMVSSLAGSVRGCLWQALLGGDRSMQGSLCHASPLVETVDSYRSWVQMQAITTRKLLCLLGNSSPHARWLSASGTAAVQLTGGRPCVSVTQEIF